MKKQTLKLLENFIKKIVQEQMLTEDMKSEKLRKLTKFLPKKTGWRGITDKFHIQLDQVTDDSVQIVKGSQAKSILNKNPESIGFFIWNGDTQFGPKGLMGVKQGSKFISFYDQHYYSHGNNKDSSTVRGYKPKGGGFNADSGIRGTVGSSRDQTRGRRGWASNPVSNFTAGDYWSDDVIVYIIDITSIKGATTDLKAQRKDNASSFATGEQIKSANATRYKNAIAALRSTKDPEFIKEYQDELDQLNAQVNSAIQKILANPQKFKYSGSMDHTVSYGTGRESRTYTTSLLKLVIKVYSDVDDIINEFKSGNVKWKDNYSVRNFIENKNKIVKIVNAINATAQK